MCIAQEEVFGPVLAILPFDTEEEAIAIANGTEFGLVAGVFTQDISRAMRCTRRLKSGQVFVNEWYAGGIETPFGGCRASVGKRARKPCTATCALKTWRSGSPGNE